jgi:predicted XRE-type DNA-binding protein
MASERNRIDEGSGDVFKDLGYPDAGERRLKVRLAMEINKEIERRALTQSSAASILGLRQPHVSDIARYQLNRFSAERLMGFLMLLGKDVEIRITQRPSRRPPATVRVNLVI